MMELSTVTVPEPVMLEHSPPALATVSVFPEIVQF